MSSTAAFAARIATGISEVVLEELEGPAGLGEQALVLRDELATRFRLRPCGARRASKKW
jgi:hypothetical protein